MSWLNDPKTNEERNNILILKEKEEKKKEEDARVPVHPYQLLYNKSASWNKSQSGNNEGTEDSGSDSSTNPIEWKNININPFVILAEKMKVANDSNIPNSNILANTNM